MTNPFQQYGNEAVPYARRRKKEKEAAKAAANTPEAKREAEKNKLWELYLESVEARRKVLIAGPYAGTAEALIAFLRQLTLSDGDQLIEMARAWQAASRTTRFLVLQLIDEAIINLRERNGLPPFDDPIFEEGDNVFISIRKILA